MNSKDKYPIGSFLRYFEDGDLGLVLNHRTSKSGVFNDDIEQALVYWFNDKDTWWMNQEWIDGECEVIELDS